MRGKCRRMDSADFVIFGDTFSAAGQPPGSSFPATSSVPEKPAGRPFALWLRSGSPLRRDMPPCQGRSAGRQPRAGAKHRAPTCAAAFWAASFHTPGRFFLPGPLSAAGSLQSRHHCFSCVTVPRSGPGARPAVRSPPPLPPRPPFGHRAPRACAAPRAGSSRPRP